MKGPALNIYECIKERDTLRALVLALPKVDEIKRGGSEGLYITHSKRTDWVDCKHYILADALAGLLRWRQKEEG